MRPHILRTLRANERPHILRTYSTYVTHILRTILSGVATGGLSPPCSLLQPRLDFILQPRQKFCLIGLICLPPYLLISCFASFIYSQTFFFLQLLGLGLISYSLCVIIIGAITYIILYILLPVSRKNKLKLLGERLKAWSKVTTDVIH